MAGISNYIDWFVWEEITRPYVNVNGGLAKQPLKLTMNE